jgi:hypothetical protein
MAQLVGQALSPANRSGSDQTHLLQLATRVGRNLLIPNKAMPASAKS